MVVKQL